MILIVVLLKKISKQNIIQFINKEDALKKGYTACNNCIK